MLETWVRSLGLNPGVRALQSFCKIRQNTKTPQRLWGAGTSPSLCMRGRVTRDQRLQSGFRANIKAPMVPGFPSSVSPPEGHVTSATPFWLQKPAGGAAMGRQVAPARGGGTGRKEDSSKHVQLTIISVVNSYLLTIEKQGRGSQCERLCVRKPTGWNRPEFHGEFGSLWMGRFGARVQSIDALLCKAF